MLRLALAFALVGLAGCNFEQVGSWGPISDREGKPHGPNAHSRSREIRAMCKSIETPQSDLCRGVDELGKEPAEGAHH